jgi:hypothetical protein
MPQIGSCWFRMLGCEDSATPGFLVSRMFGWMDASTSPN